MEFLEEKILWQERFFACPNPGGEEENKSFWRNLQFCYTIELYEYINLLSPILYESSLKSLFFGT